MAENNNVIYPFKIVIFCSFFVNVDQRVAYLIKPIFTNNHGGSKIQVDTSGSPWIKLRVGAKIKPYDMKNTI